MAHFLIPPRRVESFVDTRSIDLIQAVSDRHVLHTETHQSTTRLSMKKILTRGKILLEKY